MGLVEPGLVNGPRLAWAEYSLPELELAAPCKHGVGRSRRRTCLVSLALIGLIAEACSLSCIKIGTALMAGLAKSFARLVRCYTSGCHAFLSCSPAALSPSPVALLLP